MIRNEIVRAYSVTGLSLTKPRFGQVYTPKKATCSLHPKSDEMSFGNLWLRMVRLRSFVMHARNTLFRSGSLLLYITHL
jgi:hypothetical protein